MWSFDLAGFLCPFSTNVEPWVGLSALLVPSLWGNLGRSFSGSAEDWDNLSVSLCAAPSQWRPVQHQPLLGIQDRPTKPSRRFPFGAVPFLRLLNYPRKFCGGVKSRRHPLQPFQADTSGSWILMATRKISRESGRAWRSSLLVQGNKSDSWPDLNLFFFFW